MSETMYRIKKELKDQGISQHDFARMTGISESTISKYMTGKMEPGIDVIEKMVNALGLHLFVFKTCLGKYEGIYADYIERCLAKKIKLIENKLVEVDNILGNLEGEEPA